jgi:hypothetical protein
MDLKETDLNPRFSRKAVYRFMGGVALGALVVAIPFSYGASSALTLIQAGLASLVMLSSGLLSSLYGNQFIDAVMRVLDSFAP